MYMCMFVRFCVNKGLVNLFKDVPVLPLYI